MLSKKTIVVIGGGAAGIMTALQLSSKFEVYLIEKEKTLGRKLLVAGKGGFNLSNNATQENLINNYSPTGLLDNALNSFTANQLRLFLKELKINTFVGSSNRVFPIKGVKPVEVLNAFVQKLEEKKVNILVNHSLIDFSENEVTLLAKEKQTINLKFDYCVLALGGASWSKTGSDGLWVELLKKKEVEIIPFQASNCGVNVDWNLGFLKNHEGKPLKNIKLTINDFSVKGEALITNYGLEGNAVYPIIKEVRKCLEVGQKTTLKIDFKPKNTIEEVYNKIEQRKPKDYAACLNLNSVEHALLKIYTTKEEYLNQEIFSQKIKELVIPINSLRPIEEAISTVGGIAIDSLNEDYSLKVNSNLYAIGEMIDWDAPTGGYLLQGCFSMAAHVATSINQKG